MAFFKRFRVNIDYHIDIDGHYYSVPRALARQEVEARLCSGTVEILRHDKRVASHSRSTQRGTHTTVADPMPAAHRAHLEWTPGRFLNWGASIELDGMARFEALGTTAEGASLQECHDMH